MNAIDIRNRIVPGLFILDLDEGFGMGRVLKVTPSGPVIEWPGLIPMWTSMEDTVSSIIQREWVLVDDAWTQEIVLPRGEGHADAP